MLSQELLAEIGKFDASVTVLSPGATATAFGKVARQKDTGPLGMLMMQPRLDASH